MRKIFETLILLTACLIFSSQCFASNDFSRPAPELNSAQHQQMNIRRPKRPSPEEFDRRLNLTDEQKAFAKAQREESIQKIKPIIEQIKIKKAQIEKLSINGGSAEEIQKLNNEIKELHKTAHEIRHENMKAFEETLTEIQKKELQKMKNEGRKEFEKMHKKPVNRNY